MSLLDLPASIGQRTESIRFELVTARLEKIGDLHPSESSGASMGFQSTASTPRTVTGLVFRESEYRDVDPLTDFVRIFWALENGVEYPLGVFAFDDEEEAQTTTENSVSTPLADLSVLLSQETSTTTSIDNGGQVRDTVVELIEFCGITRYQVDDFDTALNDPYSQPAGTPAATIIAALLQQAGMLPAYFDNTGLLRVRTPPNLDVAAPDHVYDLINSRVLPDQTRKKRNLIKAPNRFIVVGTGPNNGEVVAVVDVAPDFPNSKEKTGRIRTETVHMNGPGSYDQAFRLGQTLASQDPRLRQGLVFASSPDPRHDGFDVVRFDSDTYLETAWNLELTKGGTHTHTCTKSIDVAASR